MADSDSGTHVTDIASASENGGQDETDSRKEGKFLCKGFLDNQ